LPAGADRDPKRARGAQATSLKYNADFLMHGVVLQTREKADSGGPMFHVNSSA
jgi:hypothetical protein